MLPAVYRHLGTAFSRAWFHVDKLYLATCTPGYGALKVFFTLALSLSQDQSKILNRTL